MIDKSIKKIADELRTEFAVEKPKVVSTGSIAMDGLYGGENLDKRGIELGKYYEIHSPEGAGKTTLALTYSASMIRAGYVVLYLDVEHALSSPLVDNVLKGCDREKFIDIGVSTYADADIAINKALKIKELGLVVIDSITALVPKVRREDSVEDPRPGLKSACQTALLEKYIGRKPAFLFVNQLRSSFKWNMSSKTDMAGSNALKFYADATVSFTRAKFFEENGERIGSVIKAIGQKLKTGGQPYKPYYLYIIFGKGVSNILTLTRTMIENKLVEQKGPYYTPLVANDDGEKFHGFQALSEWVADHFDQIYSILIEKKLL